MKTLKNILAFLGFLVIAAGIDDYLNGNHDISSSYTKTVEANTVPDPHRWDREKILDDGKLFEDVYYAQAKVGGCLSTGTEAALINGARNGQVTKEYCKKVYHDLVEIMGSVSAKYLNFVVSHYPEKDQLYFVGKLDPVNKRMKNATYNLGARLSYTDDKIKSDFNESIWNHRKEYENAAK